MRENYNIVHKDLNVNRFVGKALTTCIESSRIERIKGSFRIVVKKPIKKIEKENVKPDADEKNIDKAELKSKPSGKEENGLQKVSGIVTRKVKVPVKIDKEKTKMKNSGKVDIVISKLKSIDIETTLDTDDKKDDYEVPKKTLKKVVSNSKMKAKKSAANKVSSIHESPKLSEDDENEKDEEDFEPIPKKVSKTKKTVIKHPRKINRKKR